MKSNFNDCLNRLLKDEGGYTNNPPDPGGPTNFGITLVDYQKYIKRSGTADDVRRMDVNDAKRIYKSKYWDALDCDSLSSGVDYTVFDYGVNSGLGRPRKALQRFKNLSGAQLIDAINNERLSFLRSLGTFSVFGKGWTKRVSGVCAYSKVLAKKDNTTGPKTSALIAIGAALSLGAAISQFWHQHETVIIISAVVLAVLIGAAIHFYKNKGKQ